MGSDSDDFNRNVGLLTNDDISYTLDVLASRVHKTAKEKGWWDEPRSNAHCIALIHSELSEALEACRTGPFKVCDKGLTITALAEELADVIIRVLDFAKYNGVPIGEAVALKAEYNATREYKHGKKF
jgi:NTP pyrophosphatase (non-canonical NTP hydrolase)